MSQDTPNQGHRERMRQRFLHAGMNGLCEHELIELLLFYIIPRQNTNGIAHSMVNHFGSISALMEASAEQISQIKGIGEKSAQTIRLFFDMADKYSRVVPHSASLAEKDSMTDYFTGYFSSCNSESCLILSVDMNLSLINSVSLLLSELDNAPAASRNVAEIILKRHCHRIAVGINHPGRPPIPSDRDYRIIRMIAEICSHLDIELLDCVICGGQKAFSMRNTGAFSFD